MDNSSPDIHELIRELAAQRDSGLRHCRPDISRERLRRLQAALAQKFPVETSLNSAAMRRDASLDNREFQIPPIVETELTKRLTFSAEYKLNEGRPLARQMVHLSRQRLASAAAVAAAVSILVGGGLYFVGSGWHGSSTGISGDLEGPSASKSISGSSDAASLRRPGDRVFESSGEHLTLRVGKIELASLQPSLLSINQTVLADRRHREQGLPLDLPIREILIDATGPAIP
jgi:hypothetical protein